MKTRLEKLKTFIDNDDNLNYSPVCGHEIKQKDFFNGNDYECPNCDCLFCFESESGVLSK